MSELIPTHEYTSFSTLTVPEIGFSAILSSNEIHEPLISKSIYRTILMMCGD